MMFECACAYAFKYVCEWQNSHPQADFAVCWQNAPVLLLCWMVALNPIGSVCTHVWVCLCLVQRQQVCCVSRLSLRCIISPRRPKEHLPTARLRNKCMHTHSSPPSTKFVFFVRMEAQKSIHLSLFHQMLQLSCQYFHVVFLHPKVASIYYCPNTFIPNWVCQECSLTSLPLWMDANAVQMHVAPILRFQQCPKSLSRLN